MADDLDQGPGVTDHRRPSLGVLPWLRSRATRTSALAVIGLLVIAFLFLSNTKPDPNQRRLVAERAPQPLNGDRLKDYQARLTTTEEQARDRAAVPPARVLEAPAEKRPGRPSQPADPMAAERAKREYESLFASNVVVSRRPAAERPVGSTTDPRRVSTAPERTERPSLDETVDAVVRASQRAAGAPVQATPVTQPVPAQRQAGRVERSERTPPLDDSGPMHTLLEGTILEGVLTIRLNNSSASPVKVMTTTAVYSHDRDHVLIPAGTTLLGETKRAQSYGEDRAAVTFDRMIFPNGSTEPLRSALGLNQAGDAAWTGKVNRHLLSTIGVSAAIGLVTGAAQAVSGVGRAGDHSTVIIAGDVTNQASQGTQQVLQRELNRPWTITIEEGKRVRVWLAEDLSLPAYR
jgi:type IV secretion system protein TrbI